MVDRESVYRYLRNSRKALRRFVKLALYSALIDGALIAVFLLTAADLIDWSVIVSLVVAEVPIGVFLGLLLGERRGAEYRIVEHFGAMARFAHLRVHFVNGWMSAEYPDLQYFVVNENTRKAYEVREGLHTLAMGRIVRSKKYDDVIDLDRFFAANGIQVLSRPASLEELGLSLGLLSED